jgi:hypothetical protein
MRRARATSEKDLETQYVGLLKFSRAAVSEINRLQYLLLEEEKKNKKNDAEGATEEDETKKERAKFSTASHLPRSRPYPLHSQSMDAFTAYLICRGTRAMQLCYSFQRTCCECKCQRKINMAKWRPRQVDLSNE